MRDAIPPAGSSIRPGRPGAPRPGSFDPCSHEREDPGLLPRVLAGRDTRVLPGCQGRFAARRGPWRLGWRAPEPADRVRTACFLGRMDGAPVVTVEAEHPGRDWLGVRELGPWLGRAELSCLLTAAAVLNWHRLHPRCPRCGQPTGVIMAGWVRHCGNDGSDHYPRTDPAVIMSVIDADDRLLLARNESWEAGRRSVLAGFVEPGERLEDAVAREVREEVGIDVVDVRYAGNQPWPFPGSLMLGFSARATSAAITLDQAEIIEGEWYTRDELARAVACGGILLPSRISIARRLIESWYGARLRSGDDPVERQRGW